MEAVNEALKLIASALKILDNVYSEEQLQEAIKLLKDSVDKLSTCSS